MTDFAQFVSSELKGKALADALYQHELGTSLNASGAEQPNVSLQEFFAIIDSMTAEELADNPLGGRPLNTSILDNSASDASAA